MKRALQDYRVLLLDQRGHRAGRRRSADDPGRHAARSRPTYLTHFRADSIVRDAELIRQELGVDRWSVLGQSFGGFMLDDLPVDRAGGLREAFITGGLSPIGRPVDDIYGATYRRLLEANRALLRALSRTTERGSATSCAASRTRTSGCRTATG